MKRHQHTFPDGKEDGPKMAADTKTSGMVAVLCSGLYIRVLNGRHQTINSEFPDKMFKKSFPN